MNNEQELYAWCCQALLNKAGYLSEEVREFRKGETSLSHWMT